MTITAKSSLGSVAAAVSEALRGAGIRAVLTGGACATIHSRGAYQSEDIDLIVQSSPSQRTLDAAMALRNRVDLKKIRAWSAGEQKLERFEEFMTDLVAAKKLRRRRPR